MKQPYLRACQRSGALLGWSQAAQQQDDRYPKTITGAFNLLIYWKHEASSHTQSAMPKRKTNITFAVLLPRKLLQNSVLSIRLFFYIKITLNCRCMVHCVCYFSLFLELLLIEGM